MITRRTSWAASAAVAALATASLVPLTASAAPTADSSNRPVDPATGRGWQPNTPAAAAARTVLLPSGDIVRVGGANPVLLHRAGGPLIAMAAGKASYVYPATLKRQVGGVLDPALFDVNRPTTGEARVPVTIRYASADAPSAVPGVEIGRRTGTTATGVITAASSRALGRALASSSGDTLFAHVADVRALHSTQPVPQWPMHTVTVKVIGPDGMPYDGMIGYFDTIDPTKLTGVGFAAHGRAKISIPSGTVQFVADAANEDWSKFYIAPSPEYRITGPREVTLDMRTATTPIRTILNRPVSPGGAMITEYVREVSTADASMGASWVVFGEPSLQVYVAPTVGPLHSVQRLSQSVTATGGAVAAPYRYATYNGITGKIPTTPIIERVGPGNLATYRTSVAGRFDIGNASFGRSIQTASGGWSVYTPLPARRFTEYVSVGAGLFHSGSLTQYSSFEPVFAEKGVFTSKVIPAPKAGATLTDTWAQAPLHQRFADPGPAGRQQLCAACVGTGSGAKVLTIEARPLSDRTHYGSGDFVDPNYSGHIRVVADGATLVDAEGILAGTVDYPAATKVLSATQVTTRSGVPFAKAVKMTTSISARTSSAFAAPAGWWCATETGCTVLPLLSVDYTAASTDANVLPAGRQSVGLTVRQVGRSVAQGVTSVKAWVSYDGRTWSPAPVTGSGASYRAALTVPKASAGRSDIDLKVAVTDRAGSTLTEQIDGAFLLAR